MSAPSLSPETLKKNVFDLVAECREALKLGRPDMSQVEKTVRAYCESLAELSEAEARRHKQDLNDLMEAISTLEKDLVAARDNVRHELGKLNGMRKANIAYQNTDGIGKTPAWQIKSDDGQ